VCAITSCLPCLASPSPPHKHTSNKAHTRSSFPPRHKGSIPPSFRRHYYVVVRTNCARMGHTMACARRTIASSSDRIPSSSPPTHTNHTDHTTRSLTRPPSLLSLYRPGTGSRHKDLAESKSIARIQYQASSSSPHFFHLPPFLQA